MFRKLVSNLPFNPSSLGSVAFYAKRLKSESSFRKLGLVLTVIGVVVQTYAVMAPPKASLATSDTDVVYGGGTKQQLINAYVNNSDAAGHHDIRSIYDYFGIGEGELRNSKEVTIRSTDRDFWTVGRRQTTKYATPDQETIATPYFTAYYRNLHRAWDTNAYSTYPALYGHNKEGKEFWVMKTCGNVVTAGKQLVKRSPKLTIRKQSMTPSPIKPGDEVRYKISYANTGNGTANDVKISDVLPNDMEFVRLEPARTKTQTGNLIEFRHGEAASSFSLPPSTSVDVFIVARVKPTAVNGQTICNAATISGSGSRIDSNSVCIGVLKPNPDAVCSVLQKTLLKRNKIKFDAAATVQDGATISAYNFVFGDGESSLVRTSAVSASSTHEYEKPGTYEASVTVKTSQGDKTGSNCTQSVTIEQPPKSPTPIIGLDKNVSNLTTQNLNVLATRAKAADQLEYKLFATNVGDGAATNYELPAEDVSDILDYATIESVSDNGRFDSGRKLITWSKRMNIEPGETIVMTIRAKVVSPIPTTAPSASDPAKFDLRLVNIYGDKTITVDLDKPVVNQIVTTAQVLPNTGPGTSLTISFVAVVIVGYFFARSRLMARELQIVKEEYDGGVV